MTKTFIVGGRSVPSDLLLSGPRGHEIFVIDGQRPSAALLAMPQPKIDLPPRVKDWKQREKRPARKRRTRP